MMNRSLPSHIKSWLDEVGEGTKTLLIVGTLFFYSFILFCLYANIAYVGHRLEQGFLGYAVGFALIAVMLVLLRNIKQYKTLFLFGCIAPGTYMAIVHAWDASIWIGLLSVLINIALGVSGVLILKYAQDLKDEIRSERKKMTYKDLIDKKKNAGPKNPNTKVRYIKK